MRMKKRIVSLALSIVLLLLLLVGCSGDDSSGTVPDSDWTPGQTSIKLLGGSWYAENGRVYVFYSVEETNKGARDADGSIMNITCLDEEGRGLDYQSKTVYPIAAGDTIRYSGSFNYIGRAPTSLDLRFTDNLGMYDFNDTVTRHSEFAIKDLHSSSDDKFYMLSGTAVNNSNVTQGVQISAIFKRNGVIIGGDSSPSDYPIEAGKSGTFTIYLPRVFETCDLSEVTVNAYFAH